jgi:hypothetical protein
VHDAIATARERFAGESFANLRVRLIEENVRSLQRTLRLFRLAAPTLALSGVPALAGSALTLPAKGTGAVAHYRSLLPPNSGRLHVMGMDPSLAAALQGGEELAAIPETPELKAADAVIVRPENSKGACESTAKNREDR